MIENDQRKLSEKASVPRPVAALEGVEPYTPTPREGIDLLLDSNEGVGPPREKLNVLRQIDPDAVRRYPGKMEIESILASRLGIEPERVLVTAGGDEAIDRICRAYLDRERTLVQHVPTFEMIGRSARLTGAAIRDVPWMEGTLQREKMIEAAADQPGVIALVSPNNPTGSVIQPDDLRAISEAAPQSVLLLDLAYTEFADVDLTSIALELPNVIIIRTLSKAYGLAGLHVGYVAASTALIAPLRAVGGPYPVSALSLLLARAVLKSDERSIASAIERIRTEREELARILQSLGASPLSSQANFVLCRFGDATTIDEQLRARGIAVRRFPNDSTLIDRLRITCPGNAADFDRLTAALREIAAQAPAAIAPSRTN